MTSAIDRTRTSTINHLRSIPMRGSVPDEPAKRNLLLRLAHPKARNGDVTESS
jgi:hypothetical protein